MDSFPVQQPAITPSPVAQPFQKKGSLRKFLNISSWVILFALLPITVLIFLSQDSIPGDFFYPAKRGMENVVLAAASVSPATRAAFRTDLTETRFKEAQSLVISKSNSSGLTTFADEVQGTQLEVASLRSDTEREKAEEKLLAKIDQYQSGLTNLQTKTEQNLIAYSAQEIPTPTPTSSPTLTPTSVPTLTPITTQRGNGSTPTFIPTPIPTLTLVPTVIPTISVQQGNTQIAEQEKIAETLRGTKEKLNRIKKDLEEKREENKNENIKRAVKNSEGENQNKGNPNKKTEASKNTH